MPMKQSDAPDGRSRWVARSTMKDLNSSDVPSSFAASAADWISTPSLPKVTALSAGADVVRPGVADVEGAVVAGLAGSAGPTLGPQPAMTRTAAMAATDAICLMLSIMAPEGSLTEWPTRTFLR